MWKKQIRRSPLLILFTYLNGYKPQVYVPKSATSLESHALFTELMLTIKVPIATLTQPITVYISDQNSHIPM
ncbi:hypothetical protein ALT721_2520016 [Alteromonas alvinellae]|jgi:hypothetical protein